MSGQNWKVVWKKPVSTGFFFPNNCLTLKKLQCANLSTEQIVNIEISHVNSTIWTKCTIYKLVGV